MGTMLLWKLTARAQDDDADEDIVLHNILPDEEEEMIEQFGFHLGTMDIIILVLAAVALYILNAMKIKKGCWYCIFYFFFVVFLIVKCV